MTRHCDVNCVVSPPLDASFTVGQHSPLTPDTRGERGAASGRHRFQQSHSWASCCSMLVMGGCQDHLTTNSFLQRMCRSKNNNWYVCKKKNIYIYIYIVWSALSVLINLLTRLCLFIPRLYHCNMRTHTWTLISWRATAEHITSAFCILHSTSHVWPKTLWSPH